MDWEDLKRKVNELRMKEEDEGEGWDEGEEDWEEFGDEEWDWE
ncbi:MAG: hypothetical protein RXN79_01405 [Candidatus Nanopusillus sp.]